MRQWKKQYRWRSNITLRNRTVFYFQWFPVTGNTMRRYKNISIKCDINVMAIVCFVHFLRCASGSVICLQHSQRAVLANSTVQVHRLSGTEGERIHCLQPRKKYESGFNSNAKARQRNMDWMVFIACCLHIIRFSSLIVVNIRTEYVVQAALLPRTHFAIDTCNVYWSRITDNNRINC